MPNYAILWQSMAMYETTSGSQNAKRILLESAKYHHNDANIIIHRH